MRHVRFSTSAIARVQGGRKKRRLISRRSQKRTIWPGRVVNATDEACCARLRATNNNCLYPFSSLVILVSLARPFSFPSADTRASTSSLPFLPPAPFSLLSFAEVIRTRAERSQGIYRGRMPLPSKSLVPVPNPSVTLPANNKRPLSSFILARFLVIIPFIITTFCFSTFGNYLSKR